MKHFIIHLKESSGRCQELKVESGNNSGGNSILGKTHATDTCIHLLIAGILVQTGKS